MVEKLLLADDSVTIQKVVELTLADEDYTITMVSDGASALQKAEELQPDLILADIVMPELNGYELCEKIRTHPSLGNTPVMLLSSTFETYDEERGRSVGANDHIIKPFESEELLSKVRVNLQKNKTPATTPDVGASQEVSFSEDLGETVPAVSSSPEVVEDEAFDFELTDEFMEEAEEIFEDKGEEIDAPAQAGIGSSEEILAEGMSELDQMSALESLEDMPLSPEPLSEAPTTAQELSPDSLGTIPDLDEPDAVTSAASDIFFEGPSFESETPPSPAGHEIDSDLLEEEEVNVYEIPEEFATSPHAETPEGEAAAKPFQIEDPGMDLIDEFMGDEEMPPRPEAAVRQDESLTNEEIVSALEESPAPEPPATTPEPAGQEEVPQDFEEVFPTQGAPVSEWSPELAAYGGRPEAVSEEVIEKPLTDEVVDKASAPVTEETVRKIVSEKVERIASEIIERVAWEVIPDLAEILIQNEIQRLQKEVEPS